MPFHPTRRAMIALTGAALWTGAARADTIGAAPTRTIEGRAFASHWRITAPRGRDIERHRAAIEALLATIDRQMSPWRDDSDLSRFNASARGGRVAPEAARVAEAALAIARSSGGRFDPTVGPLVAQWGFGPISGAQDARWEGLFVEGDHLGKDDPGLTMDLCGIAKGRALDRVADYLRDAGEEDFLVDLGGELKSAGHHPSGRAWQVAVEDPRPTRTGPAAGLSLAPGMAVATSGLRAQSYTLGAHRYGHIIDPQAARPVEGSLGSVSVLGSDAMMADGWATALTAAGVEGPGIARERNIPALFLFETNGALDAQTTGGFDRHML